MAKWQTFATSSVKFLTPVWHLASVNLTLDLKKQYPPADFGAISKAFIIYRVLVSKVWQLIGNNVPFSWTQGHSHDTIRLDSCHCPYHSWVKKLSFPNLFTIYRYTLIETAWALTQALHKSLWQCPWTTLFYTNLCRKGATKGYRHQCIQSL